MSTSEQAPELEAVLAALQKTAKQIVENRRGARAMASTHEGRQTLVSTREQFARWIPALQKATRSLVSADELIAKTLRDKRFGIRA